MQKILGIVMIMAAFSGCGDKKDNEGSADGGGSSSSYSGRYRFQVNGCDTGEHYYSSKDEQCQQLANDELNRYCARSTRVEVYQRVCGSRMSEASADVTLPTASDVPVTYTRPRSRANGEPTRGEIEAQQQQQSVPSELTILGKLAPSLKIKTSQENGALMTILEGSFTIAGQTLPAAEIHLSYAPKVVFEGLPSDCSLSVRTFGTIRRSENQVSFMLIGIDTRSELASGGGCAPALQRFARLGFQARFENASIVSNGSVSGATVYLSVY